MPPLPTKAEISVIAEKEQVPAVLDFPTHMQSSWTKSSGLLGMAGGDIGKSPRSNWVLWFHSQNRVQGCALHWVNRSKLVWRKCMTIQWVRLDPRKKIRTNFFFFYVSLIRQLLHCRRQWSQFWERLFWCLHKKSEWTKASCPLPCLSAESQPCFPWCWKWKQHQWELSCLETPSTLLDLFAGSQAIRQSLSTCQTVRARSVVLAVPWDLPAPPLLLTQQSSHWCGCATASHCPPCWGSPMQPGAWPP